MLKKILLIIAACLLAGYMVFAIFVVNPKAPEGTVCDKMLIEIAADSKDAYFDEAEIRKLIDDAGLSPIEKNLSEINTAEIEKLLEETKSIKKAECFKAVDGTVKIRVYQRTPIMRVMSNTGDFYLDNGGELMPVPRNYAAHVPLASGHIDEEYARNELYQLALLLQQHKEWNENIEQIYIHKNKDIELTPRKGDHRIIIGKPDDFEKNIEKLQLFYKEGLDKIGWNRYSVINLKYKDRVVCTKK